MPRLCPRTWSSMAEDQIWVTNLRKLCFSRFFGLPEREIYAKKAKEEGTDKLTSRWFLRATTRHRGLPSHHAVRMIFTPSSLVVLVQGIWKLAEHVPSHNVQNRTLKERWDYKANISEICRMYLVERSAWYFLWNAAAVVTAVSPRWWHPKNVAKVTAQTAVCNWLDKSSMQQRQERCLNEMGDLSGCLCLTPSLLAKIWASCTQSSSPYQGVWCMISDVQGFVNPHGFAGKGSRGKGRGHGFWTLTKPLPSTQVGGYPRLFGRVRVVDHSNFSQPGMMYRYL